MVFYGAKHNYFWEIEHLQDEIEAMREVIKAQKQLEGREFGLPPLHVRTAGEVVAQTILGGQFVASCIGSYLQREYVNPLLHKMEPGLKIYREVPVFLTTVKFELIEGYSLKQRLMASGLLATVVCLRSLRRRPGNLLVTLGRTVLAYGAGSWLLVPEVGRHYARILAV